MKISNILFLIIVVVGLFVLTGCDSEQGSTAIPNKEVNVEGKTNEVQKEILSNAVTASVYAFSKNWDEDLEDDGIIVYPELKDASDDTVMFEGVELKVDIEVWTTKLNDNFKEVKDRLIYNGSGTIDSWKDGNPLFNGGIKVSFDDLEAVESDSDYGMLYVKIYANDKVYEAKSPIGVRIKPEIIE